jgi:hypothetical protein
MIDPAELVASSPLGARMTVRRRVDGGFTDALGYLRSSLALDAVASRSSAVPSPTSTE